MKNSRIIAAILIAGSFAMIPGCGNTTSSEPSSDSVVIEENSDVTVEEVEKSVSKANEKAADIKNKINVWVTNCDTQGAVAKKEEYTEIAITVTGGLWQAAVSNPEAFDTLSAWKIESVGSSEGTRAGNHIDTTNLTEQLEIDLANDNTDLDEAYIFAALYGGCCKSVYFVDGSTSHITELDENIGDQAEWIDSTYAWSGIAQGVLSDGTVVGTAPSI